MIFLFYLIFGGPGRGLGWLEGRLRRRLLNPLSFIFTFPLPGNNNKQHSQKLLVKSAKQSLSAMRIISNGQTTAVKLFLKINAMHRPCDRLSHCKTHFSLKRALQVLTCSCCFLFFSYLKKVLFLVTSQSNTCPLLKETFYCHCEILCRWCTVITTGLIVPTLLICVFILKFWHKNIRNCLQRGWILTGR